MDGSPELSEIYDHLAYYGENPAMQSLIAETVAHLAEEVRVFALDRCRFVSVGIGATGITLPGRIGVHYLEQESRNCWVIVLDDRVPHDQMHAMIAHEIAHAWLGHDRLGEPPEDCERQAALLAKKWGFQGNGADPDFCDRKYGLRKA